MTTGRINQVSRLCFTSQQQCNSTTTKPSNQNRDFSQQLQWHWDHQTTNRLSNIRFSKLRQSHENKSHGKRSPPRNNKLTQLGRQNALNSTKRHAPTLRCQVTRAVGSSSVQQQHSVAAPAPLHKLYCKPTQQRSTTTKLHQHTEFFLLLSSHSPMQ